jgi:hypothetical protein
MENHTEKILKNDNSIFVKNHNKTLLRVKCTKNGTVDQMESPEKVGVFVSREIYLGRYATITLESGGDGDGKHDYEGQRWQGEEHEGF